MTRGEGARYERGVPSEGGAAVRNYEKIGEEDNGSEKVRVCAE